MVLLSLFFSIVFSAAAAGIMSYISIATATGPWFETTAVLCASLLFRIFFWHWSYDRLSREVSYVAVSAGLAGMTAVAVGWSFPTLYFLDPVYFAQWVEQPIYFSLLVGVVVLAGGLLGLGIAHCFEHEMLVEKPLAFPIGELAYKMISAQNNAAQSVQLGIGAVAATLFGVLQTFTAWIPKSVIVLSRCMIGFLCIPHFVINFTLLPLFWAIGFVTGHVIALPLLVGLVSKIVAIDALHFYYFSHIRAESFMLAFVSGLMLHGIPYLLHDVAVSLYGLIMKYAHKTVVYTISWIQVVSAVVTAFCMYGVLAWYGFGIVAQLFVCSLTILTTHQLLLIAGKSGLAPFPRFATFIMVPGIVLFGFGALQITALSVFVEVCGAVAVDALFGRKLGMLVGIDRRTIAWYQLVALVVTAAVIGMVLWILVTTFGLGSAELFAQRAAARAALVRAFDFNIYVLGLGLIFGFILKYMRINSALVVGGLVMPPDISLLLIGGGFMTYIFKDKEYWYPLWSGIFAASSLWMLFQIFFSVK